MLIRTTARKAMAFTCKLDFLDADGNRFTIAVTGAAENCLLTTQESLRGVGKAGSVWRSRNPENKKFPKQCLH